MLASLASRRTGSQPVVVFGAMTWLTRNVLAAGRERAAVHRRAEGVDDAAGPRFGGMGAGLAEKRDGVADGRAVIGLIGHGAGMPLGDRHDLAAKLAARGGRDLDLVADAGLVGQAGDLERGGADGRDPADTAVVGDAGDLGGQGGEVGVHGR